jgi:peroxiredoxin
MSLLPDNLLVSDAPTRPVLSIRSKGSDRDHSPPSHLSSRSTWILRRRTRMRAVMPADVDVAVRRPVSGPSNRGRSQGLWPEGPEQAGMRRGHKIPTGGAKSTIEHARTRQNISIAHDPCAMPKDLPVPVDDGPCRHLQGAVMPRDSLPSTNDRLVDVADASGRAVFFFYPRTGRPGVPPPEGWDSIPGARGCTPESCSYRDRRRLFRAIGFEVFGVSSRSAGDQREFALRSGIPFEILSDGKACSDQFAQAPDLHREGDCYSADQEADDRDPGGCDHEGLLPSLSSRPERRRCWDASSHDNHCLVHF